MCGRFAMTLPSKKAMARFNIKEEIDLAPRHNIAPSQHVAVVRAAEPKQNELVMMRWGLIPSWAKEENSGYKMINAKAETVAEKPAFKAAFKKHRCLIPASGFYEWKAEGTARQPYFIRMKDESLFGFAGLWERWEGKAGNAIESVTIITTEANSLIGEIHDRMPVIIGRKNYNLWLNPEPLSSDNMNLLNPFDPDQLTLYPVSKTVNNPKNDTPECFERADG